MALSLGLCLHNNAQEKPVAMPEMIIACSLGSVPLSEEEQAKMETLDEKDLCVPESFMETIREIMENGEKLPEYMISGVREDFTDFPMTHFYYGIDEVLYAETEYFAKAGIITALKIPSLITGILLIIFGLYLWYSAVFRAKVDDGIMQNNLVTTGVYGLVRNPIYSTFMFFCTGALFISGNVFFYPLFFFYWGFMTVLVINTEEKWLEEVCGDEYIEYKKRVNRCIAWKRR